MSLFSVAELGLSPSTEERLTKQEVVVGGPETSVFVKRPRATTRRLSVQAFRRSIPSAHYDITMWIFVNANPIAAHSMAAQFSQASWYDRCWGVP
jgi:hypothetical protein